MSPITVSSQMGEISELPTDLEEITDIDEVYSNPAEKKSSQSSTLGHNIVPEPEVRLTLMSLLSGKQKTKKSTKTKLKITEPSSNDNSMILDKDQVNSDVDSSFTEGDLYKREHDVIELEKKIYAQGNHKSVTARDLFKQIRTVKEPLAEDEQIEVAQGISNSNSKSTGPPILESNHADESNVYPQSTASNVIEIGSEDEAEKTKHLEERIYSGSNVKRTSAKDLLKSLKQVKSAPVPAITPDQNSYVEVEESEDVIEIIDVADTPSVKPTQAKGNSAMSLLLGGYKKPKKSTLMVTLKIPTENLKTIKAKSEISKRPPQKKAMNSVFSSMMQQSQSNAPRLTPLQKLKELYPLPLARDEFHVVPVKENYINIKNYNFGLLPKVKMPSNNSANTQSEYVDDSLGRETTIYQKRYTYTPKSQSIYELVHKRLPGLENIPHLNRIYNNFIVKKQEANESALWTDYFKPTKTSDLLIPYEGKKHIKNWISNSFGRLKAQSLAIPRNVQLKKKKKKMNDSLYDDFIVPDDEDGEATEEEIFVPVLIIHGATGVGKSASVYAALHEINGYVHEINSGQARGRRDLHSTLKELSTTQLVHNVDSEDGKKGEFQRGIILFDDTDVLFEQDRTFWTVVQEIINISRRPIVITCKDMSNIPNTIIDNAKEDNAIIKIDNEINEVTRTELRNYLWLCSLSCGYDVEDEVINEIIDNCATKLNQSPHFDLRESFMELQMACYSQLKHDGAISVLKDDIQVDINSFDGSDDLEEFADKFDILSIADVISSNTISMIKAHPQENEFVDINILEESNLLRQRTLPFELNIGDLLVDKKITTDVITKHTFNKIRQYVTDFTGSRSKKLPKYLLDSPQIARRSTRSFNSSYDENSGSTTPIPDFYSRERVGIPDGSICYYLNETAYKTELAPMSRNWARFQRSLDEKEIEVYRDHNISIKQFMGWRQFQSDSTDLLSTFFY